MTMITPSYLGETIEYSSLHACRSTLEDPTQYLSGKGRQIRYTADAENLQATVAGVLEQMRGTTIASAIEQHKGSGAPTPQKGDHLRSLFEVRYCKKCSRHWVKFAVEKKSGDNWKEVHGLTVAGFTDQAVNL